MLALLKDKNFDFVERLSRLSPVANGLLLLWASALSVAPMLAHAPLIVFFVKD